MLNCCKDLNEQYLFWFFIKICCVVIFISPHACSREDFQRIPELAINPLGDRIINAFFPEGWVVPVIGLLSLEILFFSAGVYIIGLSHNYHKAERGHQAFQLWLLDWRLERLRLLCQLGFFITAGSFCIFGSCLAVFISLKVKNQMFSNVSLKSQKVRCVGVLILALAFNGFRCVFLALVLACLIQNYLRIEVESCKMVLDKTSLSFHCVAHMSIKVIWDYTKNQY